MLRDRVEYALYRSGTALARMLPLGLTRRIASTGARFVYSLGGRQVKATRENLRVAYPELSPAERERIGRASYEHFAWNALDFARSEAWNKGDVLARADFDGMEHYEAARARGKGVFLLTLHMGNFELAVQRAVLAGIELVVIGRPMRNELIYAHLRASRQSFGATLVDRDRAIPAMLRALRKNTGVAVLNDQYMSPTRGGKFVPFFGVRAASPVGVAVLAVRTGAAIVPGYIHRDGPDHHSVHLLPALDVPLCGDRTKDVEATACACNEALEAIIRRYPEQWMWGHRRFRHSPDLAEDGYTQRVGSTPRIESPRSERA